MDQLLLAGDGPEIHLLQEEAEDVDTSVMLDISVTEAVAEAEAGIEVVEDAEDAVIIIITTVLTCATELISPT